MLNELYTFAEPVQVVPFSNLKWGKFTLLHTLGKIGGLISKKRPDFDSRNYGFQKLTQLLESFIDKFEIEKRDTSNPHIKHIYVRNKL